MADLKVLLCDASSLARKLLKGLLEQEGGLKVIGEAADGAACVEQVSKLRPDLVVMDLELGATGAAEVIRQVRANGLATQFLVVSPHAKAGEQRTREALDAGAAGFVARPASVMQMENVQADLARMVRPIQPLAQGSDSGSGPKAAPRPSSGSSRSTPSTSR